MVITQLKAISDPTRYKIIALLLERHYCVRIISKKLNISESAVSQHMKILKEADIIYGKKFGYHMHYIVKTETLELLRDEMNQMILLAGQAAKEPRKCFCDYECDRKNTEEI